MTSINSSRSVNSEDTRSIVTRSLSKAMIVALCAGLASCASIPQEEPSLLESILSEAESADGCGEGRVLLCTGPMRSNADCGCVSASLLFTNPWAPGNPRSTLDGRQL